MVLYSRAPDNTFFLEGLLKCQNISYFYIFIWFIYKFRLMVLVL